MATETESATETMEMETDRTEELVSRFRHYLVATADNREQPPEKLDLFTLYSEIKTLKNEVKIESRYIKQGFVGMQEALELREDNSPRLEKKDGPELVPLLDGIIDLYDRIHASLRALPKPSQGEPQPEQKEKKSFWPPRRKRQEKERNERAKRAQRKQREQEMIISMRAGQQMLLDRILSLLLAWDIAPLAALEQRFDPHSMRAVGTDTLPDLADGTVSVEIRTGFQQQGKMLRLADVRVNRL
ncbi:MAG: nucleotide exchange factor GrpE [Candidatus Electrothrix sp. AX5]|nr:nucleotide exchange factor GrpE [Candidatus Electrothrix sp. AX5]